MSIKGAEGIQPEILAAISAAVGMAMEEPDAELMAAVVAAIIHAKNGVQAVRIKRTSSAWTSFGRQKLMNNRL